MLDGMRRQRAAYVRVPTAPCELDFLGLPFVMSGGLRLRNRVGEQISEEKRVQEHDSLCGRDTALRVARGPGRECLNYLD